MKQQPEGKDVLAQTLTIGMVLATLVFLFFKVLFF
jgi:hypothetical protein